MIVILLSLSLSLPLTSLFLTCEDELSDRNQDHNLKQSDDHSFDPLTLITDAIEIKWPYNGCSIKVIEMIRPLPNGS